MPCKEWIKSLSDRTRLIVRLETLNGEVVDFAVVLVYFIKDRWHCVTRYDTAHKTPHRDVIGLKKGLIEKEWLFHLPLDQAFSYAIEDLSKNHDDYLNYFRNH